MLIFPPDLLPPFISLLVFLSLLVHLSLSSMTKLWFSHRELLYKTQTDANSLFSSVLGFGILLKILNFTFLSLLISVFHCLPKTTLAFLVCWSVLSADQDPVFILRSMQRSCGLGRSRKLQTHELQGVLVGCTLHQLDYFPLFRFTTPATSTEFSDRY